MADDVPEIEDDEEYYVIPEAAVQYLPQEWREQIQEMAADGRAVLKSADNEIAQLSKLTTAFVTIVSLKHIQKRLTNHGFEPTLEHLLELDMLTLAFVVTYARLAEGRGGSGFAPDSLPEEFRPLHAEIIELRNERFAHNGGHHTVQDAMEIQTDMECRHFEVQLSFNFRVQIGGNPLWADLISFIDEIDANRIDRLLNRIGRTTGREWGIAKGTPPEE